jgi:hypothetical protein
MYRVACFQIKKKKDHLKCSKKFNFYTCLYSGITGMTNFSQLKNGVTNLNYFLY